MVLTREENDRGFERVTLKDSIPADADGTPVLRECWEHEILMSFWDDSGAAAFRDWWYAEGQFRLKAWIEGNNKMMIFGYTLPEIRELINYAQENDSEEMIKTIASLRGNG